jgi:hypothetical protein
MPLPAAAADKTAGRAAACTRRFAPDLTGLDCRPLLSPVMCAVHPLVKLSRIHTGLRLIPYEAVGDVTSPDGRAGLEPAAGGSIRLTQGGGPRIPYRP